MTDDGDEPVKVEATKIETPKPKVEKCDYPNFMNAKGDSCVCYEEGRNFIGEIFATSRSKELTRRVCHNMCRGQINCEWWSYYERENTKTCHLRNHITGSSTTEDDPDNAYFTSGWKKCRDVPITTGIYHT